jgi:hypothetical protein
MSSLIRYIKQALAMDAKGLVVDLVQLLPPKIIGRDQQGCVFVKHLPISSKGGDGNEKLRRVVSSGVHISTSTKVTTDAKTLFCAVGTHRQSGKGDPGTDASTIEQQQYFRLYVTGSNESIDSIAEKVRPGCPYTMAHILLGNDHAQNAKLALITRWPELNDRGADAANEEQEKLGRKLSKIEERSIRRLWGDLAGDGRAEDTADFVPDWKHPAFAKAKWKPASSMPTFDTGDVRPDDRIALARKLSKGTILRVPVITEWGERDLQDTFTKVWGVEGHSMKFDMLGLCIMHCLMRTMESNIKLIIAPIQERFIAGTGGADGIVNSNFNERMHELGIRLRIKKKDPQDPQCKECADVGLNGVEAEKLLLDFSLLLKFPAQAWKASKFLKAVFLTAEKLNLHSVTQELNSWCAVLGHYSEALTRAYIMRPTQEDRSTFTEHARLYVLKKALLRPGRLCWYDWQLWAAFPKLFEQVGSLRLLSQEAMEGQQRLNNEIARRSNGWANAGRIPDAIADLGAICKKVYMSVRARLRPKPAQWMYQQMLLNWFADSDETLTAFKELVEQEEEEEGGVMDWAAEFVPTWYAYKLFTYGYIIRLALVRQEFAQEHALELVGSREDFEDFEEGVTEEDITKLWEGKLRAARYTGRLLDEHVAYWAVDVPRGGLDEKVYRLRRRVARRQWYREHVTLYEHDFLTTDMRQEKLINKANRGGERRLVQVDIAIFDGGDAEEDEDTERVPGRKRARRQPAGRR